MKVITGNSLRDGRVIYLGVDDQWKVQLSEARLLSDEEAPGILEAASARITEVADLYLIEATETNAASGREALKETIRSQGPTIRTDLGKQAGHL